MSLRPAVTFILGLLVGGGLFFIFGNPFASRGSDLVDEYYQLKPLSVVQMDGDVVDFEVVIADSFEERKRGLQYVAHLGSNQGMWFVFQDETVKTFWMKDTLIPLDILFVDSKFKVVSIAQNLPPCFQVDPEQKNCEYTSSVEKVKYALEITGGMADAEGISIGDTIQL